VGNDRHDVPVWSRAREAIRVDRRPHPWLGLARALRLHQWPKNLLVFVPLLTSHRIFERDAFVIGVHAFVAFSLTASAVYLANDLIDLEDDRRHPRKHARPLAAGEVPIETALALIPVLAIAASLVALQLAPDFVALLGAYVAANLLYSLGLKRVVLVDVFVLAGLYTVRILAGAAAAAVPLSHWLLAFSMFVFLSLAFAKRFVEVSNVAARAETEVAGRGYLARDGPLVGMLGTCAGYLSVLVFALYVTSREVVVLYRSPAILWFAVPVLLYWISRVWLLAHRGALNEDPVVFALRDPQSYAAGAAMLLVISAAK
jgi:4-hydroxybenzoate polyprenyltransferase